MKTEQINVTYETHCGSDLSVVNAARQSFNKQKTEFTDADKGLLHFLASGMMTKDWELFLDKIENIAQSGDRTKLKNELIKYKRKAQHWAPFGHPHVTIRVRMPIFLARQFVKHQIGGTWSEESRRYISEEPTFYFEPVMHTRPDNIKQGAGSETLPFDHQAYNAVVDVAEYAKDIYMSLVQDSKVAPEEAREILTLNMMTGITWTGSLLFWSRVCTQRLDPHAQTAARLLAQQIDDIIRPLYPHSWQELVGSLDDYQE